MVARALLAKKAAVNDRMAGKPVANFRVLRLKGGIGSLQAYGGRPVLANLWATWCDPCKREMPALERLWKTNRTQGFVVVGIDEGEQRAAVARFVRSVGVTYPILVDQDLRYATASSVLGFPTSVFVRRDGTVDAVVTGELDYAQMQARAERILGTKR
jgi:thiol-disulfide isomerase/thioredoxin